MSEGILFKRPRLLQNAMKTVRKYHSKCLMFGENLSGSLVSSVFCGRYVCITINMERNILV
jgi:hypothetical protein